MAIAFFVVRLPIHYQFWLGRLIGNLFQRIGGRRARIAAQNIDLCFPDLSVQEKQRLLKQVFASTGIAVMEWLAIPGTIYHIEYKENLEEAKWRVLDKVVYDDLSVRRFSFGDFMNKNIPRRFYRMVVVE